MLKLRKSGTPRAKGAVRLEAVLLLVLFAAALAAGGALLVLKRQHERRARLAATETVLHEGDALLDAVGALGIACSTNTAPAVWRRFSTVVDSAFAVRKDVQSISVTRDGVTVFQRQAGGLEMPPAPPGPHSAGLRARAAAHVHPDETRIAPGSLDIGGKPHPVFVITRTYKLDDGGEVVTEATFRREAVGDEEQTARALVSSLFTLAVTVMSLSFACCALVMAVALARDRRRAKRARQEEHLAFSGVLANGILHDFRNPMSAVRLDAQMLGKEIKRPDGFREARVRDLAERIARTMERMDKVFQEFLFLARPADEKPEAVDIAQILRECVDTLAPRSEQAGVTVTLECCGLLPPAAAYPFALRRALLNVLMNAIQFAPRDSEVKIVIAGLDNRVVLDILDRGPGIPPDKRDSVFEMFTTARPEGTGLGLFLARTAIRRCGGDIRAFGREGGGADIRVTLFAAETATADNK
ncbi:MAG: HAMP domain-containing sensor histidine kinase [Kiritimatiellae bacterium]|nr:HAMP domain-containing sensor histidine kinase [Kiritimatiellia bacterium]MDD4025760.1 HAMP domain-containing sensor histidine kinase [Kiritimatiellia bacterium]MDD4621996.1 HAMP domain-containing sensor histidine kinase [Kiritimatiellia bacterium]